MTQNLQNFVKGASMLRSVANRVPADAWDNASCCADWSARQVAGHIVWGLETVGNLAEGGGMASEMPEAERAGDDPAASVRAAVDGAIAKLDQPGALQRMAPPAFGGMSLDQFLAIMSVDSMTHAWDIADATGIEHGIDDASAEVAHQTLAPMAPMLRGPGRFGDEVPTDSDSAVDRLIAFTGRTSVRA
ncbi:MAG: TIGR03086 family metal-binding protein [Ilumatobacter sp.]